MARFDTVIKNGMIFDGTRIPRYRGDIGIKDGVIAEIGFISEIDAAKVIDAKGLHVAPGFIDLHTHYDAQLFWDPYCSLSSWHGITSVVIGNCGFGFAPVKPEMRERAMLTMTRVEAIPLVSMRQGMPWDWVTFPEFLDSVERTPKAMNILPYVPVGPILIWVLGFEDAKAGRKPTAAEEAEICRLLEESLDAGGCGWSAQRLPITGPSALQLDYDGTPMATDVMHNDTARALARVLGKRNQGFIQTLLRSGDEKADRKHLEELAEISRRPLLYNVVQAVDHAPDVHRDTLRWLTGCQERGLKIYGQGLTTDAGYTFTFEDWSLFDDLPAWREATVGTHAEKLAKLSDPGRRTALRQAMAVTITGPIENIAVVGPKSAETEKWRDHTLAHISELTGKHPIDAMLDIAVADDLATEFYAAQLNERNDLLQEIVDNPYVIFGVSDGGAHTKFLTAGRFPTETLVRVVREQNMLSLEEAHWRLSALPAMMAGFEDRGVIRPGAAADMVIYDYQNLAVCPSEVVHDLPGGEWRRIQRAKGYRYILVNGEITIQDDKETNAYSGKLLRYGGKAPAIRKLAAE